MRLQSVSINIAQIMQTYVFIYRGGIPEGRQKATESLTKWKTWLNKLGRALIDSGAPLKTAKTLGDSTGASDRPVSGYSIVRARSSQEAVDLAKDCPILEEKGTIEVAEAIGR
jgi:hypothetical protein